MGKKLQHLVAAAITLVAVPAMVNGQSVISPSNVSPPAEYENVHVQKLYSDNHATSFLIWIKKEVKRHYHAAHTEYVEMLEGEGYIVIDEDTIQLKAGDLVYIPAKTRHSFTTTSVTPVKLLSIQSPEFNGEDRIFEE